MTWMTLAWSLSSNTAYIYILLIYITDFLHQFYLIIKFYLIENEKLIVIYFLMSCLNAILMTHQTIYYCFLCQIVPLWSYCSVLDQFSDVNASYCLLVIIILFSVDIMDNTFLHNQFGVLTYFHIFYWTKNIKICIQFNDIYLVCIY